MLKKYLYLERRRLLKFIITGAIIGFIYGLFEYYIRLDQGDAQAQIPLLIRASIAGALIYTSVLVLDFSIAKFFNRARFIEVVVYKSLIMSAMIALWLFIVNFTWYLINSESFDQQFQNYMTGGMFIVNLSVTFAILIVLVTIGQVNSLHRRGELFKYIMGRYHQPKEVYRAFCFIDLKGSTTLAEKMGHILYARFLKEYYSDITVAILQTDAQVYQYVGDEIVLSWDKRKALRNYNAFRCYFLMRQIIEKNKPKYMEKYGAIPEFRAGLHGGLVTVTWVGEVKREIVYIGDILNTAARIQEECKTVHIDFLASGDIVREIDNPDGIQFEFVEETIPRGKANQIELYSVSLA